MSNCIELTDVSWKAGHAFELQDLTLRVPMGSIYGFGDVVSPATPEPAC